MGRVWRAADEILDRQVAVKEMRIDGLDAEDTRTRRERTLREARATARIDHPNVVRVYDVVDEGERLWIVMELVAGRSLERMMVEDGPLGPREAARIGLGLVAALRQVHAGGVLHRDIKPGNVLVENSGRRVVLTDFGIAAIQDAKALTMVGMLVGSPDYMAPERVSGRPQGPPSDVWSLGATLCAALGGHSPFSRDTTLATLHAVLYEEPELPASAGPLRDILAALLEKEPSVRPGLEELESALSPVAYPPTVLTVPTMPVGGGEGGDTGEPAERGEERGEELGDEGEPEQPGAPEPELAAEPAARQESPTPAFLDPSLVRAARDPRMPEPEPNQDAVPPQPPAAEEPARPAEPASASTEAASELRSEVRSEASSSNSSGTPPRRSGISLVRAQAVTEPRPVRPPAPPPPSPAPPAPLRPLLGPHPARVPHPAPVSPAELPRPAAPFTPRRARRRTGLVAAAGVVVVGVVVGIVLTSSNGSSGDPSAGSSPKTSSATSPAPTGTPSPTVEGTSRPPSLPPGTHQEAGGFAWATPKGWRRDLKTGAEVHYTSPDGSQELVGKSSLARGDLMQTWEKSEQDAHRGQDYRKIRLEKTTFRGYPAVVWEYTFTLKGVAWHARLLGFDANGKSYQINTWYQPPVETQALKIYDKVKQSFVVL
jgi:serine/threonine protein kinase